MFCHVNQKTKDIFVSMFEMLQFSNLLGCCYRKGNLLFTPDGYQLISPVGNRVSIFDLKRFVMFCILFQWDKNFRRGFRLFVRYCGQGSSLLDPSAETVERSSVLAQERGGELFGVCNCMHDV